MFDDRRQFASEIDLRADAHEPTAFLERLKDMARVEGNERSVHYLFHRDGTGVEWFGSTMATPSHANSAIMAAAEPFTR